MMLITLGNINPAIDRLMDIIIEAVYTMQATDNNSFKIVPLHTDETPKSSENSGTVIYVQYK